VKIGEFFAFLFVGILLNVFFLLQIRQNSLSGTLSSNIGQLTNLVLFDAYGNNLTGSIPTTIGSLSESLTILDLSENDFTGTIPDAINYMPSLETLSLHQKTNSKGGLSGRVPSFEYSTRLSSVFLSSNSLSGTLPENFMVNSKNFGEVITVDLSSNKISGGIPSSWTRFGYLDLYIGDNRIEYISGDICEMTGWLDGAVGDHSSCDSILCDVGSFSSLGRHTDYSPCVPCENAVYMGSTSCGELNDDEVLSILQAFYSSTDGNNWYSNSGWFSGKHFCDDWYGITCDNAGMQIVKIDLSENGLSGTPSPLLFNLPRLSQLDLSSNPIDFNFEGIEVAKDLRTLRLSETQVSSIRGIENSIGIQYLHLTSCHLSGSIPDELLKLSQLRGLYLNYNQFTGRLPWEIGQLERLEELYMLRNGLSGQIPASIGNLSNLKVLAIAENKFSGTIPPEINRLENLKVLAIQGEGEGSVYSTSTEYYDVGGYYYNGYYYSDTKENYLDNTNADDYGYYYRRRLRRDSSSRSKRHLRRLNANTNTNGLSGPLPTLDKAKNLKEIFLADNSLTGSIPYTFLAGIEDKTKNIFIDLENNYLTGVVPASLTQFNDLDIYLGGNEFSDIASGLCMMKEWLGGRVAENDCNAILCPKNTFSASGMNDSDYACEPCPASTVAPFMGSLECISEAEQIEKDERRILEAIYNALNGANWLSQENWMDKDTSFCEWHGITCISGKESVQAISLQKNGLVGTMPGTVFHMVNLQELNLADNQITVSFEHIDDASSLEYINIGATLTPSLSGIDKAPALTDLHANDLQLNSVPEEIFSLTSLRILYLSNNQFVSNIPDFSSLTNLAFFQCERCDFTGKIPAWFGDLVKLEYLSLAGNMLTGEIPSSLMQLPSLSHLNLSDQAPRGGGLTGNLPSFSALLNLKELYLNKNKISGSIPDDFLEAVYGESVVVDLRKNEISGSIPLILAESFDDLTLLLANNHITDIPQSICDLQPGWNKGDLKQYGCDGFLCPKGSYSPIGRKAEGDFFDCISCEDTSADAYNFFGSTSCGTSQQLDALEALYMSLDGPDWKNSDGWLENDSFCSWYGIECDDVGEHVTSLMLDENGLSGDVPEEIFSLTSLTHIRMKMNDITFDFDGIEQLSKLETLYLSETKITSLKGIGKAKTLRKFDATGTNINAIPDEMYNLSNLEELYLNYCTIQGSLSSKIGQLVSIKDLQLLKNKLTGTLPSTIGNLSNLVELHLGENDFSGTIPSALSSLPNLEKVSLYRTTPLGASPGGPVDTAKRAGGLTGNVPTFNKTPKLSAVYLGYNSLTGDLPSSFLRGISDKSLDITVDLTNNEITGEVPSGLKQFSRLSIFLVGNKIDALDSSLCEMENWMDGAVKYRGCDAILCPLGTFNEYGREANEGSSCSTCPFTYTAPYYGSVSCIPDTGEYDERDILKKFYEATKGSKWLYSDNWLDKDISICEWHGITCDSDIGGSSVVAGIHLPSNRLSGTVPPHIFRLQHLKVLNLRENNVDVQLSAIPENDSIEEIFLDFTDISSIDGVSKLKNIRTLHLQQNNFRGASLPPELFSMTSLESLYISDSNIGGTLSPLVGNLSNLVDFFW